MIGRMQEMNQLERMYTSERFEFMVMYGRRRIGKTTILQEFSKTHKTIFFSAQEKNDALNLQDFSRLVQEYFDGNFISNFANWEDALNYLGRKSQDKRIVLIVDEFPFLAETNPSIKSILQHKIDHDWKDRNLFLILCGSSVSFMLDDVMGYKSPLYGRSTGSMEVQPFDYLESAAFFPNYSEEEKLIAYGILGGVPRYLNAFDNRKKRRHQNRTHSAHSGVSLCAVSGVWSDTGVRRSHRQRQDIYSDSDRCFCGGRRCYPDLIGKKTDSEGVCGCRWRNSRR